MRWEFILPNPLIYILKTIIRLTADRMANLFRNMSGTDQLFNLAGLLDIILLLSQIRHTVILQFLVFANDNSKINYIKPCHLMKCLTLGYILLLYKFGVLRILLMNIDNGFITEVWHSRRLHHWFNTYSRNIIMLETLFNK